MSLVSLEKTNLLLRKEKEGALPPSLAEKSFQTIFIVLLTKFYLCAVLNLVVKTLIKFGNIYVFINQLSQQFANQNCHYKSRQHHNCRYTNPNRQGHLGKIPICHCYFSFQRTLCILYHVFDFFSIQLTLFAGKFINYFSYSMNYLCCLNNSNFFTYCLSSNHKRCN